MFRFFLRHWTRLSSSGGRSAADVPALCFGDIIASFSTFSRFSSAARIRRRCSVDRSSRSLLGSAAIMVMCPSQPPRNRPRAHLLPLAHARSRIRPLRAPLFVLCTTGYRPGIAKSADGHRSESLGSRNSGWPQLPRFGAHDVVMRSASLSLRAQRSPRRRSA